VSKAETELIAISDRYFLAVAIASRHLPRA
jgi:hypothetical protein